MPALLLSSFLAVSLSAAPNNPEDVFARPPEVSIPFGCGKVFPVSQAHATGSHLQNDTWAWDFRMPEGTPIVAAMDGVVRLARGDSTAGGCDPKFAADANYVVVAHDQGLETQYLHFVSVVVKPGERVRAGQLLGFSGKTGWACGAHLHFKLAQQKGTGWNNPSIPARLSGYGDAELNTLVSAPACLPEDRVYIAEGSNAVRAPNASILESASAVMRSPAPAPNTTPYAASKTAAGGGGKVR